MSNATSIYPELDWYLQLGYWGHKVGNIFTYGIHTNDIWWDSDSTFKKNFQKIENADLSLSNIKAFKCQFSDDYLKSLPQKEKLKYQQGTYGFKAQDVEKIYPELTQKDDATGNYSINYIGFIPILVDAYQKQQDVISAQNLRIKELETSIEQIKSKLGLTNSNQGDNKYKSSKSQNNSIGNSLNEKGSFLCQNAPNPFSVETNISYFVDSEVKSASLVLSLSPSM